MICFKILVLVTLASRLSSQRIVTKKGVKAATVACRSVIDGRIPDFTRTIFHDCVGGCNGCIDINNPGNAGLDRYVDALEALYVNFNIAQHMSRADFWATCGLEAILAGERRSKTRGKISVSLRYGREDCEGGPYAASNNVFPDPHHGVVPTLKFFNDQFGLNSEESTAILGAHSLGEAKARNSGFEGPWVDNGKALDNMYYQDLLNPAKQWTQHDIRNNPADPRWQWDDVGVDFMMLNVDICLAKDIQPNTAGEVAVKEFNSLTEDSPLLPFTQHFAQDNAYWLKIFSQAFEKMVHTLPASSTAVLYDPPPK